MKTGFEELMMGMARRRDDVEVGRSNNVDDIKKALETKHLEGLVIGDVLVQAEGIDGSTTYAKSADTVVFVRYLTDEERSKLLTSREQGVSFYDEDCIVCPRVTGACPQYNLVDSRAYKKA